MIDIKSETQTTYQLDMVHGAVFKDHSKPRHISLIHRADYSDTHDSHLMITVGRAWRRVREGRGKGCHGNPLLNDAQASPRSWGQEEDHRECLVCVYGDGFYSGSRTS